MQERELDGEKKPCRKCEEKIPVNSNYCPYCGHDQAIFEYRETPRETEEDKAKITPEPKLEKDAQDLAELIDQIRAENEKYLLSGINPVFTAYLPHTRRARRYGSRSEAAG